MAKKNRSKYMVGFLTFLAALAALFFTNNHLKQPILKSSKHDEPSEEPLQIFSQCQEGGDLYSCVKQVCDQVQKDVTPINRPEVDTNIAENQDLAFFQGGIVFRGVKVTNPAKPGSEAAHQFIANADKLAVAQSKRNETALIAKMDKLGFRKNEQASLFLVRLNSLAHHARVANCAGMSSLVVSKLLAQPLFNTTAGTSILIQDKKNKSSRMYHTFVGVPIEKSTIICDAWRPANPKLASTRVCPKNFDTANKDCQLYNPKFWQALNTGDMKWPDISNLDQKAKIFFRQTARKLLTEFNKQQRQGVADYQAFLKKNGYKSTEEEISQPRP